MPPNPRKKATTPQAARKQPSTDSPTDLTGHAEDLRVELARIQREAQERYDAARATFAAEMEAAQREGSKAAKEAYLEYLAVFHRFQTDKEETPITQVYRAQFDYQEAHQKAVAEIQKVQEERRAAYDEATRAIQEEIREAWEGALVDYVRALTADLKSIDPAAIDAATLASVGQGMVFAAMCAQSAGPAPAAR